jgi:hypothetical protein
MVLAWLGSDLFFNMLLKNSKFSLPYILEIPEPPFFGQRSFTVNSYLIHIEPYYLIQ